MSAADLSPQEGMDLLNKLITESKRVEVFMVSMSFGMVTCSLRGIPSIKSDGRVWIADKGFKPGDPNFAFLPLAASAAKYGDERIAKDFPFMADRFREHFASVLMFIFATGAVIGLFELAETEAGA
jgi:hypothetical protein